MAEPFMNRVRDERLTFGECRDALIELMNLGFCWRCESADNELFRDVINGTHRP